MPSNVQRLIDAGIVSSDLSESDQEMIDQLTELEVTTLIGVATRLYPNDPMAVKIEDLRSGQLRIFFPL